MRVPAARGFRSSQYQIFSGPLGLAGLPTDYVRPDRQSAMLHPVLLVQSAIRRLLTYPIGAAGSVAFLAGRIRPEVPWRNFRGVELWLIESTTRGPFFFASANP
jgi:hypothetical protein